MEKSAEAILQSTLTSVCGIFDFCTRTGKYLRREVAGMSVCPIQRDYNEVILAVLSVTLHIFKQLLCKEHTTGTKA